ncbi:biotin attachment protein [Mycobacterium manitobense]|uniref:Biotin attachment protein n=1 Tax=[Mycobacterium] manitobense TaxID=190147 RepID=A0A9X3BVS3_9MYCO|nr:biotin/lipoyl-containing protein [[Mycobacterium] manitobense]MCV7169577.1 biotin attachment protein [[Mycobacterium] manitobense]
MRVEVRLPQWGMGMTEGEVLEWLKEVGDDVAEGEGLVEIETAKVNEVLESPAGGKLVEILAEVGEVKEVRAVLAIIDTGAE